MPGRSCRWFAYCTHLDDGTQVHGHAGAAQTLVEHPPLHGVPQAALVTVLHNHCSAPSQIANKVNTAGVSSGANTPPPHTPTNPKAVVCIPTSHCHPPGLESDSDSTTDTSNSNGPQTVSRIQPRPTRPSGDWPSMYGQAYTTNRYHVPLSAPCDQPIMYQPMPVHSWPCLLSLHPPMLHVANDLSSSGSSLLKRTLIRPSGWFTLGVVPGGHNHNHNTV